MTIAAYVRRSAGRLQDQHHQARRLALLADNIAEPWVSWCCERGWLTRGDLHHPTQCVREQG
ncbi:hypothetical protein [Streptomyces sp. NBC_00842]|uniref:hypothetical protein n=1 Tax=Streptomyces sp. NBC_00842 TaxID=2975848 RepID=UPI0038641A41|nr:hypothetical protein OH821_21955 [Streptomyces sp. NBC_00842]